MKNLLARNAAGLPLTPGERAILKLVKGLLLAAAFSAIPPILMFFQSQDMAHIDWAAAGKYSLAAFLMALLMAGLKYVQAHYDGPVAQAATTLVEDANNFLRVWGGIPNDVKFEPTLPPDLPTLSAEPPAQ